MPRFYFHIVARSVTLDETGVTLASVEAAAAYASDIARGLRDQGEIKTGSIVVENEAAGDMFEVPIAGLSS